MEWGGGWCWRSRLRWDWGLKGVRLGGCGGLEWGWVAGLGEEGDLRDGLWSESGGGRGSEEMACRVDRVGCGLKERWGCCVGGACG